MRKWIKDEFVSSPIGFGLTMLLLTLCLCGAALIVAATVMRIAGGNP